MPFDYYYRLSRRDQATYRKSDAVATIEVPDAESWASAVADLREALEAGGRAAVQSAAGELVGGLVGGLGLPAVRVKVLAHRPEISGGELHGLYEAEEGELAVITVWMRTAAQGRVVAFKTFLRTLLHEVVHHWDYEGLKLAESFHTQGFLRRESSLVRQLLGAAPASKTPVRAQAATPTPVAEAPARSRRPRVAKPETSQLELPW